MDFDVLQGARTTFSVADLDRDGLLDLVVGDTYGSVRYYRNVGRKTQPVFAQAMLSGDMKLRIVPFAADWDGDGKPDVIGSAANGEVMLWRKLGSNQFAKPERLQMPPVPYGPFVAVAERAE